jgi:superkiller protein 3
MKSAMSGRSLVLAALLAVAVNGQTVEELKRQADTLKARGDAAGALKLMERAASADPKSAAIEDEVGFLLAVLQRNAEAKTHFARAIELDPRYASAQFHLGVVYWLEKDPDRAIPLLQTAAALAPEVFDYRLKLGLAFFEVGHYSESVTELQAATRIDARNGAAWNSLGLSLQMTDRLDESREAYAKAVELSPDDLLARNRYGFMLVQSREPE